MTFFAICLEEEKRNRKKKLQNGGEQLFLWVGRKGFSPIFALRVKISKSSDIWHWRDESREFWRLKEAFFQMSRIVSQIRGC